MTHTSLPGEPVQQISDDAITLPYFFVSAGLETLFLNEFLLGKNLRESESESVYEYLPTRS